MAIPDENLSTLADIRTKVRRLTRSPSTSQLTNAQIDDYVNNFILYDVPEFINERQLSFYTRPNVDTYTTIGGNNPDDPLYNFKNRYTLIETPVFIDGEESWLSLSRVNFFSTYTLDYTTEQIGTGDGATTNFTGTLASQPILRNNVKFFSISANNYGVTLIDTPDLDANDYETPTGVINEQNSAANQGQINYITGVYNVTFVARPPIANEPVYASYVPYTAAKPTSVLFFNNTFTLRPVPDRAYKVTLNVYVRPTELLAAADEPELAERWQYFAYGAAKKVFEDRMDMESVQMIMPEFRQQRLLAQRRTIMQQTIKRTPTIYAWNDVNKSQSRV